MKNIFFITELFYPNKTSTAYIMTQIAKHFAKKNNVSAICSSAPYDNNVREQNNEEVDNIKMILCDTPKVDKNRALSKILGALTVTLVFAIKIFKHVRKGDIVFAVTNPFLLVILLGIIKKIRSFKYILLVHDVFPENAVPAGILSKNSFFYKILKYIYDWSYSQADERIVLGRDMEVLINQKLIKKGRTHIVENWYDSDLVFDPGFDRNEYLGANLDGKIVIGFAGNLGRVQKVYDFVKLFSKVKNDKLVLLLVGDGAEKDSIVDYIKKENLSNIICLNPKGRNEQSSFLNCFDIGLITLASEMYGLGVPSKSYNILYLGRPILYVGDQNSEIDLLIKEYQVGNSFAWEHESDIVEYLESLEKYDISILDNARDLARSRFSENIIMSKLEKIV